jgi:hypothetical protein
MQFMLYMIRFIFWKFAGAIMAAGSKFGYVYAKSLLFGHDYFELVPVWIEVHARLLRVAVGVLGEGTGLHLGDGLAPFSEAAADAETCNSRM